MRIKKWLFVFLGLIIIIASTIAICNYIIAKSAKGRLYNDVTDIPYNKVALLLGTGKFLASGAMNPYYKYRIDAASQLIKNGKAKYLVISGDNSSKDYNEPQQMKEDLVAAGIDSTIIFLDYAGFRTFDSIVRLKEIFGQNSVTIISQRFHNERAIYIASREGVTAIGFNAKDVGSSSGFKTQVREKLARVKVFVDFLFGKKPKFLGNKVTIPS
jgi:SanA protein